MQLAKTDNQPTNNKHTGMHVRVKGGLCIIFESTPVKKASKNDRIHSFCCHDK